MDRRREGHPARGQQAGEQPHRQRRGLVDYQHVRRVVAIGVASFVAESAVGLPLYDVRGRGRWREPHGAAADCPNDSGVAPALVHVGKGVHRTEQRPRADEHLAGRGVLGSRHEDALAVGGECAGSDAGRAGLAAAAVGLDHHGTAALGERFEGGDRLALVGGQAGPVRGRREASVVGSRGLRGGPARRRVGQAVALDDSPIDLPVHVHDSHSRVRAEGVDQPPSEVARHVRHVERRHGQRGVEVVAAVRPRVERRRDEDEQAAAVDGSDHAPEGVREEGVVGVEHDGGAGPAEQAVGPPLADALAAEGVPRADHRGLGPRHAGRVERRFGGVVARLAVAREHEQPSLVGPAGLPPQVAGERGYVRGWVICSGVAAVVGHCRW